MASATIIVPTFNRAAFLRTAIDSLLRQTHQPTQVIVVDDGSSDSTGEILAAYQDQITVIRKENGGKSSAINAALPLATGAYIWVFDDDDIAMPDALERHVKTLEKNRSAAFSYSTYYKFSELDADGSPIVQGEWPLPEVDDQDYFLELMINDYVAGPGCVVRANIQQRAGLYDISMLRSQDYQMTVRWCLLGPPVKVKGERPTYFQRQHKGDRGTNERQHPAEKRHLVWREYDKRMVKSLNDEMSVTDYLPPALRMNPTGPGTLARAELRRWVVLLRKGLFEEAIEFVSILSSTDLSSPSLVADARKWIPRAFSRNLTVTELFEHPKIAARLGRELRQMQQPIVRQVLLRALLNRAWKALRRGALKEVVMVAVVTIKLLGIPFRWLGLLRALPHSA